MAAVTAIVLTKNVASRIERTLESLKWSDEILVVDSGSTDGTVDLCRRYTQNILEHPYESYARQQNFALDHVQTEWVFLCDADEEVPSGLADEIRSTLEKPEHDGYYLYRDNYFFGKRIRRLGWGSDEVMRLFRTAKGRFEDKSVHPTVRIDGSTGWLRKRIRHEPYPTLEEYLEKLGRYSLWGARDAHRKGKRANLWTLFFHPVGRFFKMYILRGGFLEGAHGLVLSLLGTMSVFAKYARLWEIQTNESRSDSDKSQA